MYHKLLFFLMGLCMILAPTGAGATSQVIECWFAPDWKDSVRQAMAISRALSDKSGFTITPRIAKSYPEILAAFGEGPDMHLVYVGSFVQTIIRERHLGKPLVQAQTGQEFYSGIMVYPRGGNPQQILATSPEEIAFTSGASSGESSAKAATDGKAAIAAPNHSATCNAVRTGKAKAGFVKNWWWEKNMGRFPMLTAYIVADISQGKNPDYVLTASINMPDEVAEKIRTAAKESADIFGAAGMADFDPATLDFSLSLMKRGKIDPLTYSW